MPQIIQGTGPTLGGQPSSPYNRNIRNINRLPVPGPVDPVEPAEGGSFSTINLLPPSAPVTSVTAHDDMIS